MRKSPQAVLVRITLGAELCVSRQECSHLPSICIENGNSFTIAKTRDKEVSKTLNLLKEVI